MWKPFKIDNFKWWLNLAPPDTIEDNQFSIAKNMFYNKKKQIQTRYWITNFGDPIGTNKPIPSTFFYQRDDTLARILIAASGDNIYRYDGTSAWNSFSGNLLEFETLPWITSNRVRKDFAVYKNSVYIGDGVNPYSAYNGTVFGQIWVGSAQTSVTFDNTTDVITKNSHGLAANDEIFFSVSGWALPTGITAYQVYYAITITTNTFQISTTKNGAAVNFTTNWTWTPQYQKLSQPRCRYIQYLGDRIYWAGDDANPISLYYTAAAPSDANSLNASVVVIGGDEDAGVINGVNLYNQLVTVFRSGKIFTVNVATPSSSPIDSQSWGYSDRSIQDVGNQQLFLTERGIDTLSKRYGVDGTGSIESKSLSENVESLLALITERQRNANVAMYIREKNNYIFQFDTNDDNVPDTTLVYSSLVGAFTQYTYPNIYDFTRYLESDNSVKFLAASGSTDQMFEIETGFDDFWEPISHQLRTKAYDFGEPGAFKTFGFVDLIWQKSKNFQIPVSIIVDWTVVWGGFITDEDITSSSSVETLWTRTIGTDTLTGDPITEEIQFYNYVCRVPLYVTWTDLSVDLSSEWGSRTFSQMRVGVDGEPVDVFWFSNYA